jgi:hypothetical protein
VERAMREKRAGPHLATSSAWAVIRVGGDAEAALLDRLPAGCGRERYARFSAP